MKVFVAASYSSQVDYTTGKVFTEYRTWLENILKIIESQGHTTFCALKADQYKINNADPAAAFSLDIARIKSSDTLIALLTDKPSAGVQTEIGIAVALEKRVLLAHLPEHKLSYFNEAMLKARAVNEILLPINASKLGELLA